MTFDLATADPQGSAALALLREAALEARALYPESFAPDGPWPVNDPLGPRDVFVLAYRDGAAVGSGALRAIDAESAEVRRVFVTRAARRAGIARSLMAELERRARALGYRWLRLETGMRQHAAMALYAACGYAHTAAFGPYVGDPTSVCYEKALADPAPAFVDDDVPSPIDLQQMRDAEAWEASAFEKRPCRPQFFAAFSRRVGALHAAPSAPSPRVLELGSGPGFLALRLLGDHASIRYVALDSSAAMHRLAEKRLQAFGERVTFVERSFRDAGWEAGLGDFACVVTHQAVHELRHKRHHHALHAAVRRILRPEGVYLVCDHFCGPGGQADDRLYMSVAEQRASLAHAGFGRIEPILETGGLVMHAATGTATSTEIP